MQLKEYSHVHCIGVGGIGISAIARLFLSLGKKVSGSDGATSRITEDIQKEGVTFFLGHRKEHIEESVDLVIYTIAVSEDNEELMEARRKGLRVLSYPEALGEITKEYTTIAVCGTHGKTTTTAMIASMLKACGKNPTVIVGSLLSDGGSNFVQGDSEYLVVEACEYRRSFLNLHPKFVVVTNIDADHLDYYKDLDDIKSAFQEFVDKLPENGKIVSHEDVEFLGNHIHYTTEGLDRSKIALSVLGAHNKENAALALTLGEALGLPLEEAYKGLLTFRGTWRRLEYKGVWHDVALYDDYGHHPAEIKATLQALREKYPEEKYKVIAVFQPHLFSRTKEHLEEWAESFEDATTVCVLPIYAAREKDDGSISSEDVVEKMHNAVCMQSFDEVKDYVLKNPHYNTVLITIGAGNVTDLHASLTPVVH